MDVAGWLGREKLQLSDSNAPTSDTERVEMRQLRQKAADQLEPRSPVVTRFPVPDSEAGLTKALLAGHPDAIKVLCERHSGELLQVAACILGPDTMLDSVVADSIRRSLASLTQLNEPRALREWLIARLIVVARQRLRVRRYWGWLFPGRQLALARDGRHYSDKLLASYRILDRMNARRRIVFCLVVIHSMSCSEVAVVLGVSLAMVQKTIDRACRDFAHRAADEPSIRPLEHLTA
jgi:DNA-directed RNA polymerase specialized sigma24 family protein